MEDLDTEWNGGGCSPKSKALYCWGRIPFKDRRARNILPFNGKDAEGASAMSTKFVALRLLWIGEVEAAGADTNGQLEHNACLHLSG